MRLMISKQYTCLFRKRIFLMAIVVLMLFASSVKINAQEPPPRPPTITLVNDLSFGAFYNGTTGGTITISSGGSRTSTGDVILIGLGFPVSAAHFNVYSNPGTVISILNGPDIPLTWSGYSMNLHIGSTDPAAPFVNSNPYTIPTVLSVGATLTVGVPASNPPGSYSGTFEITFVFE